MPDSSTVWPVRVRVRGRLTADQITALDTIPGWWWTPTPTPAVTNAVARRGKTEGPVLRRSWVELSEQTQVDELVH